MKPAWVALAFALATPLAGAIDEREFACEEAYQHVEECCGYAPSFQCGTTCDPIDTSLETADCLRNASCEALERSGACDNPTAAVCK
jgi:hypothetical protein